MCPACLATISMMVAGVISTGGVTALVVKTIGRGNGNSGAGVDRGEQNLQNLEAKEKQQ